jgi:hypothetical protein
MGRSWLDGNSVAYQFLSMLAVLGGLLALQWRLLVRVLDDRLAAAACFVFTLLMLQPGSYWGRENLAYHQALPLVFLLGAAHIALHAGWRAPLRHAAVFVLGLLAGFSYISGAFGMLAMATGFLLVAWAGRALPERPRLVGAAVALGAAGLLSATTQFVRAVLPVIGEADRGDAQMALPHQLEFWIFYFGKLARSLLLPRESPGFSAVVLVVACVVLFAAVGWTVRHLRSAQGDARVARVGMVLVPLAALVFGYLLLVAAGRTHLRPLQANSVAEIFSFAFQRFHFFWATLLWPWVAAAVLLALHRHGQQPGGAPGWWPRAVAGLLLAGGVAAMVGQGALEHADQFAVDGRFRHETVVCLQAQLQAGQKIDCPEFNLQDMRGAYLHARRMKASFVRYFNLLPVPLGADNPWPWFRLSRDHDRVMVVDIGPGSRLRSAAGDDPMYQIVVSDDSTRSCVVLDVTARLRVERASSAQLFYRPLGTADYEERHSTTRDLAPGVNLLQFRLESTAGFERLLRFDPVRGRQEFTLEELEVRCRLRDPRFIGDGLFSVRTNPLSVQRIRVERVPGTNDRYRAGDDPQFVVDLGDPQTLAACGRLRAVARMSVERADRAQLFVRKRGVASFTVETAPIVDVPAGPELRNVEFVIDSPDGFEDAIRFDPVMLPQQFRLWDLAVTCQQRVPLVVPK